MKWFAWVGNLRGRASEVSTRRSWISALDDLTDLGNMADICHLTGEFGLSGKVIPHVTVIAPMSEAELCQYIVVMHPAQNS